MRKILLALSLALAWLGIARAEQVAAPPALISGDTLAAKIADALAVHAPISGRYHVAFADPSFVLMLPAGAQGRFDIAALSYDPMRQTFAVNFSFAGPGGQPQIAGAVGTAYAVIDVPAPARDLATGEIITAADIVSVELPAERASATLLTSPDALVGQAARRSLHARQPVYSYDLKKPVVVKKGELVTIVFSLPGLELTAAGQALADGGKDDVISVLNARSRRTIEGRVTGAGTVSVQTPATLAAAQP